MATGVRFVVIFVENQEYVLIINILVIKAMQLGVGAIVLLSEGKAAHCWGGSGGVRKNYETYQKISMLSSLLAINKLLKSLKSFYSSA